MMAKTVMEAMKILIFWMWIMINIGYPFRLWTSFNYF